MDEIAARSMKILNMVTFDRPTAQKQAAAQVEMDDEAEYARLKGDAKTQADDIVRRAEELPGLIAKAIGAQAKLDKMYLDALLANGFQPAEAALVVAHRGTTFLTQ